MVKLLVAGLVALTASIGAVGVTPSVNAATPLVRQSGYVAYGHAYVTLSDRNSSLAVRVGPSKDDTSIGGLYFGERVTLIRVSSNSEWYLISSDSGKYGWVNAGYLEFPEMDH
jgi:uncharacterized protein YgiM (DUF1202 family)